MVPFRVTRSARTSVMSSVSHHSVPSLQVHQPTPSSSTLRTTQVYGHSIATSPGTCPRVCTSTSSRDPPTSSVTSHDRSSRPAGITTTVSSFPHLLQLQQHANQALQGLTIISHFKSILVCKGNSSGGSVVRGSPQTH